jgi:hypothetical protein
MSMDKYAREVALGILAEKGLFDPGHHRLIEGIAATAVLSKNGTILDPAGALFTLPVPLLFAHNWLMPIGRVTRARVTPAGLQFTAQVANFKLAWLPQIWDGLKAGSIPAVSAGASGRTRAEIRWNWDELSVLEEGANPQAIITCVKEVYQADVVFLDGRKRRETIHRDIRNNVARGVPIPTRARASM